MPIAKFEMPDGRIARFEVPDGTTPEQAQSMFEAELPSLLKMGATATKTPKAPDLNVDPTQGMSTIDKLRAGVGKSIVDTGRGIGQLFGAVSNEDVKEARKLDKALMDTTAGTIGNIGGNIGMALLPGGALKGLSKVASAVKAPVVATALSNAGGTLLAPKSVGSALAVGGAMGALQPSTSTGEAFGNMALGGGLSALFPLVGATYNIGRSAIEPFYQKGKEQIVSRQLARIVGPQAGQAVENLRNAKPLIPGSLPTAGQVADIPSIAALERTASQIDPNVMNQYAGRMRAQMDARLAALDDIADPVKRDFFEGMLAETDKKLYRDALKGNIEQERMTAYAKGQITQLMNNPYIQDAIPIAKKLAQAGGIKTGGEEGSLQGMHYLKLALDDMLSGEASTSLGRTQKRAVMEAQEKLVKLIDRLSPDYQIARTESAALRKPINAIDVATAIKKKSFSPSAEKLNAESFAKALSDDTAKQATGFRKATLASVFEPSQLDMLNNIKSDLQRAQFAQNAGRGVGSDTVQKLAYSNFIDEAGVPTWIRRFAPTNAIGNIIGRIGDAGYGRANQELAAMLGETLLDPAITADLLERGMLGNAPGIGNLISRGGSSLGMMTPALLGGMRE